MAVYLVAIIMLSFYFCCMPVKIAVVLRVSPDPALGTGLALFENRFALKKAGRRARGRKKHAPRKKDRLDPEKLAARSALHRMLRYGLRSLKPEQIFLRGRIGTGDAASTALLCGGIRCLEGALTAVAPPEAVRFEFVPDFSGKCDFDFGGMLSLRAGHIILAALIGALDYGKRRLSQWKKNIRLKILCAPQWKTSAIWWMWIP